VAPPEAAPGRPGNRQKWMESRWAVLVSLFFLFGPLALPMLWRSRQFSPVWKIILTTLVLGATALIIGLLWYVVNKALEPLTDLRELQGL
jgi:RsiW-degrading membrane proteinase PrsW (M82 family)